nr:hypothetical protein CFP56_42744 [Quercus suber]
MYLATRAITVMMVVGAKIYIATNCNYLMSSGCLSLGGDHVVDGVKGGNWGKGGSGENVNVGDGGGGDGGERVVNGDGSRVGTGGSDGGGMSRMKT